MASRMQRQRGFTLTELMISAGIAAILMSVAVPSYLGTVDRRRVIGSANELSADLQYARSVAVGKNLATTLTTSTTGYSITDSTGTGYKTVTMPTNVSVTNGISVTFASLNGTANAATLYISSSTSSAKAQLTTNVMGRVQLSCNSSGNASEYKAC